MLCIEWQEHGGPVTAPPTRTGFGSSLTGAMLKSTLGAEIVADYAPEGLKWRLDLPRGCNRS